MGASGVQMAALACVLVSMNLSVRERWICGVGVAGVDGAEISGRGRGSKIGGLGWVGCGGGVVGGGVDAVRRIGSGASVVVLTLWVSGSLLSGAVDVLKLVGGGEGGSG